MKESILITLPPELKEEILATASEQKISVSELMRESFRYWKEKKSSSKQKPSILDLAAFTSKVRKVLTYINEIEKAKPSSLALRAIYEDILEKVSEDEKLTQIVKAEFFAKFGIPPLLLKKPGLRVYPDVLIIDCLQCKPEYLELIPIDKLQERIDILVENFPFHHYDIIAELQRKVWELCMSNEKHEGGDEACESLSQTQK